MGTLARLGEAGAPHDDASYTGEVSTSPVSMDYFRSKVLEFQGVLNALDSGYESAVIALQTPGIDDATANDLAQMIADYKAKRGTLRATVEAINLGAAAVNAAGGRMPELSLPGTLGLLPALPFAAIAALGVAATLIAWGNTWLQGLNDRLKTAQLMEGASPEDQQALRQAIVTSDAAVRAADSASSVGALAPLLKWGAIIVGGFLAWKAIAPMLGAGRRENPADYDDPDADY